MPGLMDRLFKPKVVKPEAITTPKPERAAAFVEQAKIAPLPKEAAAVGRPADVTSAEVRASIPGVPDALRSTPLPTPKPEAYQGTGRVRANTGLLDGQVTRSTSQYAASSAELSDSHNKYDQARTEQILENPAELRKAAVADSITASNRGEGLVTSRVGVVRGVDDKVEAVESWSARQAREARETAARDEREKLAA